jgi:hypothetical protein
MHKVSFMLMTLFHPMPTDGQKADSFSAPVQVYRGCWTVRYAVLSNTIRPVYSAQIDNYKGRKWSAVRQPTASANVVYDGAYECGLKVH